MGVRLAIYAALIGGVLLSVFLAYKHYTGLLDTISSQQAELQAKEQKIAQSEARIAAMQDTIRDMRRNQDIAQKELANARQQSANLRKVFQGHDFGNLVEKKPGLIEKRINNAVARLFKEREELSK